MSKELCSLTETLETDTQRDWETERQRHLHGLKNIRGFLVDRLVQVASSMKNIKYKIKILVRFFWTVKNAMLS
jgi:hypothetical protein